MKKKSNSLGLFLIFNTFLFNLSFFFVLIHALKCAWVDSVGWPHGA